MKGTQRENIWPDGSREASYVVMLGADRPFP